MRILIIGREADPSLEKVYKQHLAEKLGNENIKIFSSQDMFLKYYHTSIIHKVLFRLGFKCIYYDINRKLINEVKEFQPDILWVFKGMEIFPKTLHDLRLNYKVPIFNFNPDNPFFFSGKGSGNQNITQSINLYDHHFTYERLVKVKFDSLGLSASLLPFGYSISDEIFSESLIQEEILKVCFVGNPDKHRIKFLTELANKGIKIDLYGNDWGAVIRHQNITAFEPVLRNEFWMVLRKYRVQLNMMRPHNPETHNMRTFEIPGIGGIQLAPDTEDHRKYFEEGTEIYLYNDLDECIFKINKLLKLGFKSAALIRIAAKNKAIHNKYTYRDRTEQVLLKFNEYLGGV